MGRRRRTGRRSSPGDGFAEFIVGLVFMIIGSLIKRGIFEKTPRRRKVVPQKTRFFDVPPIDVYDDRDVDEEDDDDERDDLKEGKDVNDDNMS